MTPEAQRIAIAEACGWKKGGLDCDGYQIWIHPSGARQYWAYVPDYLNDLNAMHEAEEVIRANQFRFVNYPQELFKVIARREWNGDLGYFTFNFINATAAQRAEAFLKTLGLWKDKNA